MKEFEYLSVCGGVVAAYPETVRAETLSEAVEKALREQNEAHPNGQHTIQSIKELGEVPAPKRFAIKVNEDIKTARILVQPAEPGSDYWYDLESIEYLERLARDFKSFEERQYELVSEDEFGY